MLLPVSDDNDDHAYPYVNLSLILICVFVYLGQVLLTADELKAFFLSFGFVSGKYVPAGYAALPLLQKPVALLKAFFDPVGTAWVQAITSTFLHVGPLHLAGNMLFLWIFGDNVEHVMGRARYLAFFILTGVLAQFAQTLVGGPIDIPCIGASGAISAVMGAYLVYHPNAIINVFLMVPLSGDSDGYVDSNRDEDDEPFLRLRAHTYLLFYLATQLLTGYLAWGTDYLDVAVWAHIGGYVFGFVLAKIFRDPAMMFKADADRLFGSGGGGTGLKKNVYNEYIFRVMPVSRQKGRHKRPSMQERQKKAGQGPVRKLARRKKREQADMHRKKRHQRPPLAEVHATGYKEALRRKRMGSDWMKHGKEIFDPARTGSAGDMSHFGHLGAACTAFGNYPGIWFFCGGTALDLFIGRPIRTRHDIDIGILRDEQEELPKHFPGVKISYVTPEVAGKKRWQGGHIALPVHELYLELPGEHLEILLNEADETHWIYRRDARIRRELSKAVLNNEQGVPYLSPEIVLLYKSKHMRERDIIDFDSTKAALGVEQRDWLKAALQTCYLGAHPWSQSLA